MLGVCFFDMTGDEMPMGGEASGEPLAVKRGK
jgi:hypothetical protein